MPRLEPWSGAARACASLLIWVAAAAGCESEPDPSSAGGGSAPSAALPLATRATPGGGSPPAAGRPAAFDDGSTTLRDGTRVALVPEGIEVRPSGGTRALTLATASVGRGADVTRATYAAWEHPGRDTRKMQTARGELTEVVTASEESVEQAWLIPAEPEGTGDLVVSVEASGLGPARRAEAGVLFGHGDDVVAYSDGVLIGADGARHDIASTPTERGIELRVPAALLASVRYPAVLDPTIGPPVRPIVRTPTSFASSYNDLRAMATGSGYVVLARQFSTSPYLLFTASGPGLVDALPATVTGLASSCVALEAFWTGTEIMFFCTVGTTLHVHRIAADGTLVSSSSPAVSVGTELAVARGSSGYLVTWTQGATTARDVVGVRLDAAGVLLDASPLGIANAVGAQYASTVAATPAGYLVAYTDDRYVDAPTLDVRTTTVASNGSVANADGEALFVSTTVPESAPLLFASGGRYLLTSRNGSTARTQLAEVDAQGALVGTPLVLTSLLGFHSAAFRDGAFLVYELAATHRILSWAPSAATVTTQTKTAVAISYADIAWAADEVFAVVTYTRLTGYISDLEAIEAEPATVTFEHQKPAMNAQGIASDGALYALVHHESGTLHAEWLRADGSLFAGPIALAASALADEVDLRGHVEATATGFAVAMPSTRIYMFSPQGVQAVNQLTSATSDSPRLSFDGTTLMAFYNGSVARVVNSNGTLGTSYTVSSAAGTKEDVTADAFEGVQLVVWTDGRNVVSSGRDIYALRMLADGTRLDQNAIPITTDTGDDTIAEVAATDQGWLVSWRTSTGTLGVRAVLADGSVGTPQSYSFGANPATQQALAWGGSRALLVGYSTNGNRLAGFLLDHEGAQVEGPFDLGSERPATGLGKVASVGNDDFLLGYESFDGVSRSDQLFVRRVSGTDPRGAECTMNDECDSGFCVDGFCCGSACGGGVAGDCLSCSVAAGGYVDGSCVFSSATTVCRSAAAPCDGAELCSGSSGVCPDDALLPLGAVCRASTAPCDAAETCDGVTLGCPADAIALAGAVCRPAVSGCDVAETCNGTTLDCPTDLVRDAGTVCRAATNTCDVAEICDGSSNSCPSNSTLPTGTLCRPAANDCDMPEYCQFGFVFPDFGSICPSDTKMPNGTSCSDGLGCNGTERCSAGACTLAGTALDCSDGNACTTDSCAEPGTCGHASVAGCCTSAAQCDDGNTCTADVCSGNACVHNPIAGCCTSVADCNDGNACTADLCSANTCTFTAIVGCCTSAAQCDDGNECTSDLCSGNACSFAAIAGCCTSDGQCTDGDACTIDECADNACTHSPDPLCAMPDLGVAMPDLGVAMPDLGVAMPDLGVAMPDLGVATPDLGVGGDAGDPVDAAQPEDAGELDDLGADASWDAGDDAASPDAASPDAAQPDAGEGVDAGPLPPTSGGGCGCRVAASVTGGAELPLGASLGLFGLFGLVVVRLRRRRGSAAERKRAGSR